MSDAQENGHVEKTDVATNGDADGDAQIESGKALISGETEPVEEDSHVIDSQYSLDFNGLQSSSSGFVVTPITIQLPQPTYAQTLPRFQSESESKPTPSTFIIHPQPGETIQDIRATLQEWVGGYWLGPYSLRIPGKEKEDGRGKLLRKGKEGVEVREGEKLSDWLAIEEVFEHLEPGKGERELVVQRGKLRVRSHQFQRLTPCTPLEPYSESDARQSVLRLREYLSSGQESAAIFPTIGVNGGSSILEGILDGTLSEPELESTSTKTEEKPSKKGKKPPTVKADTEDDVKLFSDWQGLPRSDLAKAPLSMPPIPHSSCLRSIIFSPFNPPPSHLKQKGHLLYVNVVTLEGESLMLVCTLRGWYVAKSTAPTLSFDPTPRSTPKSHESHSLMDLLHGISPLFTSTLRSMQSGGQEHAREPIATVPIPQYPPAHPWLATAPTNASIHPDFMKTQLAYGYTGAVTPDSLEGARDWNEELQNARELPRTSTHERLLRERVLQKTHAEFTAAAVRGTMAIARGDLSPLNPHEDQKAHMFLANNIFYTKGVNSLDAYTHLGGDEAARISHAKDAQGVKVLNKLDIDNVYLLGHAVIDWAGERWVCQSVLPGIFSRHKEDAPEPSEETKTGDEKKAGDEVKPGEEEWVKVNGHSRESSKNENQKTAVEETKAEPDNYLIIYGADSEAGIAKLNWDAGMHKVMEKIAASKSLALHKMKDSQDQEYDFWTSVDVKGLRGSDSRRYLLDLPRLSPVDIEWLEKDLEGKILEPRPRLLGKEDDSAWEEELLSDGPAYPHRVVLLRPEMTAKWKELALKEVVHGQIQKNKEKKAEDGAEGADETQVEIAAETLAAVTDMRFNADAFVDQPIKASGEGLSMTFQPSTQTDESDPAIKAVRDASKAIREMVIPQMIFEFMLSEASHLVDGLSLTKHMHSKGINMRYLGYVHRVVDRMVPTVPERDKKKTPFSGIILVVSESHTNWGTCAHSL